MVTTAAMLHESTASFEISPFGILSSCAAQTLEQLTQLKVWRLEENDLVENLIVK